MITADIYAITRQELLNYKDRNLNNAIRACFAVGADLNGEVTSDELKEILRLLLLNRGINTRNLSAASQTICQFTRNAYAKHKNGEHFATKLERGNTARFIYNSSCCFQADYDLVIDSIISSCDFKIKYRQLGGYPTIYIDGADTNNYTANKNIMLHNGSNLKGKCDGTEGNVTRIAFSFSPDHPDQGTVHPKQCVAPLKCTERSHKKQKIHQRF
jgi:hypothetical protein